MTKYHNSLVIPLLLLTLFINPLSNLPAQAAAIRPIVFPVDGQHSFIDDFDQLRSGGRTHQATDIIATKHTPVVAVVDGTVSYVVSPQASWGYAVYLKDAEGYQYNYLHLNNDTPDTDDGLGGEVYAYAPGISRGTVVKKGQLIGWVGDSGNAEDVGAHLHFEIEDPTGAMVDPYASLLAAISVSDLNNPKPLTTTIIIPKNYQLVKYSTSPTVYLLANDVMSEILDEQSFISLGLSWSAIKTIPDSEQYRLGLPIQTAPNVIIIHEGQVPPAGMRSYLFTQTLQEGSEGEEVRQLQIKLKSLGYFTYPSITTHFGPATKQAVIAFQKAKGLEQIGVVGPKTRALLNS
jgi:hypothetical protein